MRLFIAFDFELRLKRELSAFLEKLRPLAPSAKWVSGSNLHVTLVFLGYLPDDQVPEIERAIASSLAPARPLALSVVSGGAFGSQKKPRVLWLGLSGEIDQVRRLHASLEENLKPFGYLPEKREYTPHLTLARSKEPSGDPELANCLPLLRTADFGAFELGQIVLFRSDLSRKGPTYTAIREFSL